MLAGAVGLPLVHEGGVAKVPVHGPVVNRVAPK
jgi:hypothetical protein